MDRGMKEAITRTCKRVGDMHATAERVASLESRIAKLRAALGHIAERSIVIYANPTVAFEIAEKALAEDGGGKDG